MNTKVLTETASAIGDRVSEAKETVEDIARSAGKKLDAGRENAVDTLRAAAASVRATARQSSDAINRIAKGTANKLESTASFVEDCDMKGVSRDLRKFGHRHLAGSLLAAAALGFLAGTVLIRGVRPGGAGD